MKRGLLSGDEAVGKLAEVGAKYAEAVRIKPDDHEIFSNWGSALMAEAALLSGDAAH